MGAGSSSSTSNAGIGVGGIHFQQTESKFRKDLGPKFVWCQLLDIGVVVASLCVIIPLNLFQKRFGPTGKVTKR